MFRTVQACELKEVITRFGADSFPCAVSRYLKDAVRYAAFFFVKDLVLQPFG